MFTRGLSGLIFPLYGLGTELFERMFDKKIEISEILYYPYCREALTNFKEAGFTVVTYKDFYVFTLAVRKPFRNAKVASKLYQHFLDNIINKYFSEKKLYRVETRTWGDNIVAKKLLKKLGFSLTQVVSHERGENIHTEYYVKQIQ